MKMMSTSRKNDLESLMYLVIYMLNDQSIPGLPYGADSDNFDIYTIF
jgi:hypothetical protein